MKYIHHILQFLLILCFSFSQSFAIYKTTNASKENKSNVIKDTTKLDLKDIKMSLSTFFLASDLIDDIRHSYRAEGSKLFLGEKSSEVYVKAIRVALKLYEITDNKKYLEDAYTFTEKGKVAVLLDAFYDSNAKKFAGLPDSLVEHEREVRIDLAFYEKSLLEEELKGKEADSAKIVLWSEKVFILRQEYEKLVLRLENDFNDYYKLKYSPFTVTSAEAREKLLDNNTMILEYFLGDTVLYVFQLTKDNFDVTKVSKVEWFDNQVVKMRDAIINNNYRRFTELSYVLYQSVVKPVSIPQNIKNIIIIPDGILGYLPFEALLTKEANQNNQDYMQLSYWIKDYNISYNYSATLMVEMMQKKVDKTKQKKDFIAFAPVEFDNAQLKIPGGDTTTIATLPATETEVLNIAKLFKKKDAVKLYLRKNAVEENIKSPELEDYKYVHFATHGYINEKKPGLSSIFCRPSSDSASTEDGFLYSGETYNLHLNSDLLVLSACQTGLGKIVKGEGIVGLTRGFLFSGTKSIIVSVWQVADESTSTLMIDFYKNLVNNKTIPQSLRDTKLKMISNASYAAPYFWAPFILIGK